jgi:23S rRNA pseudouridine2457 synthase
MIIGQEKTLQYFIVYKPYQVLSQFSAQENKLTLKNFFDVPKDVYPVGRLDFDSEGLLILTNDASLNQRLLNPKFAHEREYWTQVEGAISQEAITQLQYGVEINVGGEKYKTKNCRAEIFVQTPETADRIPPIRFRKNIPTSWIKIILTEGKNRQVRKMLAAVGFPVLRLIRYRIEKVALHEMQPSQMLKLSRAELYRQLNI